MCVCWYVQFCQAVALATAFSPHNGQESGQPLDGPVGDQGDQHKATKNVTPKDADPYKAKAKAKARALSSDALAEALAKGKRREAEMVAAQAARQEEADAAWRNWARRQDLSPVGAPPSK